MVAIPRGVSPKSTAAWRAITAQIVGARLSRL
jgi:hypothetical protein